LLRAGQKIEAIKHYRAMHGVDLKTAKDAVDARARELGR
jgi:ribosomal protein L7/L12